MQLLSRRSVLFAGVGSTLLPLCASAAQNYRFVTLQWGDTLEIAREKLRVAGYSKLEAIRSASPESVARGAFVAKFTGQINRMQFSGSAVFDRGRLVRTILEFNLDPMTYARQHRELEELLALKYGKGRTGKRAGGGMRSRQIWGQEPDETLEIALYKVPRELFERTFITYSSREVHRLEARTKELGDAAARERHGAEGAAKIREASKF